MFWPQDISFTASGFGTYVTCLLNRAPHDTASVAIESFAPYKLMKDPASLLPRLTGATANQRGANSYGVVKKAKTTI